MERRTKEIESPFTGAKFTIRELDPAILQAFSKPETMEIKTLRLKIQDVIDDIKTEEDRQQKLGTKDQETLDKMNAELEKYYSEITKLQALDEAEIKNRQKIIQYGTISPTIDTFEKYLDLGKDATWLYSNIVILSKVPDNYASVIESFFRPEQRDGTKDDTGSKNVQPEAKSDT